MLSYRIPCSPMNKIYNVTFNKIFEKTAAKPNGPCLVMVATQWNLPKKGNALQKTIFKEVVG